MTERMVDFEKVKAQVSMTDIIDHYFDDVETFTQKGNSLIGSCPFENHGDESSFRISLEKNCFNCFAGCKGGNVIDFVAKKEDISLKRAALLIAEWFDLSDVEYKRGKKNKVEKREEPITAEKSNEATSAGKEEKNNGVGETPSAEAPALDTESLLTAVMPFQTAVKKVKDGKVDPDDLVVVQPSTLQFLHDLAAADRKMGS